jgi:ribosomal protein S18 acetylase RimI-like enzyme
LDILRCQLGGGFPLIRVRPLESSDTDWIIGLLVEHWGSVKVVSRGKIHYADRLPGFVTLDNGKRVGLVTYRAENDECEIVTLNSLVEGIGIGTALVKAVRSIAASNRFRRVWLITTNDNLKALRFYQRRGFSLVALYRKALEVSRNLKPEIPLIGLDGIPIRDELELEIPL